PYSIVRYWTLAGLYHNKSPYLGEAANMCLYDEAAEIRLLAQVFLSALNPQTSRQSPPVTELLKADLNSEEFVTVWQALRVIRIVPIPPLAQEVCQQLDRSARDQSGESVSLTYDVLFALSNPEMAHAAAQYLSIEPGTEELVERVIAVARNSDTNAIKSFSALLCVFDKERVDQAIAQAMRNPQTQNVARPIRTYLAEYRRDASISNPFVPGFASDTVDVTNDRLDIGEDVQTLTAVMLSKEVKPPLAIGLFGDWGSGKSYFMKSMQRSAKRIAKHARKTDDPKFFGYIAQIEFNAWHYADTNLWASLVSYILEKLAAHVTPTLTPEEQQAALLSELGSTKLIVSNAESEKRRVEHTIVQRQTELQDLQNKRQEKEIKLSDLQISDLRTLLKDEQPVKDLHELLRQMGIPAVINGMTDVSEAVAQAHTARGRANAMLMALGKPANRWFILGLLGLLLFIIPALAHLVRNYLQQNDVVTFVSTLAVQVSAFVGGLAAIIRKVSAQVSSSLSQVEAAKQKVDELISSKRKVVTQEETQLQKEIVLLKAQEQETTARLAAAVTQVAELENRIRTLREGRSLAKFLADRNLSEDYRKHLGLISVIRQDFESLKERLNKIDPAAPGSPRRVDRIILYIDDLDRCPTEKVMEVLQAVHLLLAYELFVVVVGVDPRWLLHSLGTTYSAFGKNSTSNDHNTTIGRATPQNYLEKIFQIPFSLRPMTQTGYGKLIGGLLSPSQPPNVDPAPVAQREPTPRTIEDDQTSRVKISPDPTLVREKSAHPAQIQGTPLEEPSTPPASKHPEQVTKEETEEETELVINKESLSIRTWEAGFAERLYTLIPTPRAAKRFSNVYRILKAPVRSEHLARFEGTAEVLGEFQVPMLLLAILVGSSTEATWLFPKLQLRAAGGSNMRNTLLDIAALGTDLPTLSALQEKIQPVVADDGFPTSPQVFLEWLPRVSRFSFELGKVLPLELNRFNHA
ncbi:MAG: hypothetical protein ICV83_26290, partial [Cytophagales bacterium]|nr:hypothetical protein [Cytophagales bacterium]